MKKLLLVSMLLLVFAVAMYAGTARNIYQKVTCDAPYDVLTYVTNTGVTTSADYRVRVWMLERPAEILTTELGQPGYTAPGALRLVKITAAQPYAAILCQIGTFTTQWVAGNTLHYEVTRLATNEVAEFNLVIPVGTGTYTEQTLQVIPPFPPAGYNLNVTSTPAGAAIIKDGLDTGFVTPHTFFPGEAGTYTLGVMAGYTPWTPAEYVVPALTAETTIDFQAVELNYYNYTLNVNGPAGYDVTGPTGTLPFPAIFVAPDTDMDNELLGVYTPSAAPAGFVWNYATIDVTADLFSAAKASAMGSRSNGSKATYNYVANIEFALVALPTYTVNLTTNPAGNITPSTVGPTWDVTATYGTYTPDPIAGGTWTPASLTIDDTTVWTADGANWVLNQEFVWAPTYDYPEGTPVVVVIGTVTVNGGNGNDVPAGSVPPIPNGAFVPEFQTVMQLLGAGPWTISFGTTQPWGAWYSYTSAAWMVVPNVGGMITFVIPAGGKDIPEVPMVFGPVDPTLPVELSSFNAVLTAENFVKLTWTSESETNMLGYRVYRAEADDYAAATLITPVMIEATNSSTHQAYSITDNEVAINTTYYYWLEAVDMSHSVLYGPNAILVTGNVTPNIPTVTTLGNAYPNPFRNQTSIALEVKENETATVTIYNILGQVVKTYNKGQGTHTINWDGKDARGNACGSGIYFYRLTSPSMNQTKKMVIVK